MSYKYSQSSLDKLKTCHPDLQKLFNEAIKHLDISILEGARDKERQEELVKTGMSKTLNSKHLKQKDGYSHAVDAMPYPIDWNNWQRNYLFAGFIKGLAASMGIKIRMGADWNGNFDTKDQTFHDIPHFEIVLD
jgi:peptidoglycan L-alanyl-D-glutamate endopeptidase CwlK